jgi:DNA-binding NarL/FixJ family response regulator
MGSAVTTLFIIDDRESVRQALVQRLSRVPGIQVLGTAGTSQDAIAQARDTHPEVVLIELKLSDGLGLDTLRAIRADNPSTRVIVLTSYADDFERHLALKLGAERYLLKDINSQVLADAILGRNAVPDRPGGT